ncbi:MAG: putative glucose/sorbosone dehydrogenase, partial [Hyphomicrobiales bacterium]|nr:putative glucose/sorbosone dehydrogenase [Hyphomicrobiales bacterium]
KQLGENAPLPEANQYLFPPMKIVAPTPWGDAETPTAPAGFTVTAVGRGMHQPRNILPLSNGDVLVAESGGPAGEPVTRPKDLIYGLVKARGHSPVKPGQRILLLHDAKGDGTAYETTVLISNLHSPFGMVVLNGSLYVANTDAIMRYPFNIGDRTITGEGEKLTDLPAGPIDHHWTKSLTVSPDGTKLYVGVGSNSNIVERGLEAERGRAAIYEVDAKNGAMREFASGLRNPNGLTFEPTTKVLWAVVNERDELGNDLVPDYMTSVKHGGFYGWPWSYYGSHIDIRVHPQRPGMVAKAIVPDYSLSSHVAPLGLAFNTGGSFPEQYRGGAFVGEHGSWDRTVLNGYQVAFVPFSAGKPSGKAVPFVQGFIGPDGSVHGRPVGVAFDAKGALIIADDVGNAVWRVSANPKAATLTHPPSSVGAHP